VSRTATAKKVTPKTQPKSRGSAYDHLREEQASLPVNDENTQINGQQVIAREVATWDKDSAGLEHFIGKPLQSVEKVLLSDDSIVFQCRHKLAPECTYAKTSMRSVFSHQRTHSAVRLLSEAQQELDEIKARLDRQRQNRSNGARNGLQRRRQAEQAAVNAVVAREQQLPKLREKHMPVPSEVDRGSDLGVAARRVSIAYSAVVEATNELNTAIIHYMRLSATAAKESAEVDPEIIKKASKWDAFVALQAE